MAQSESQFRAVARHWERLHECPLEDDPVGDCPTCGGESWNWEHDSDGERSYISFLDCDQCNKTCTCCGEKLGAREPDARGWCPECVDFEECWECGRVVKKCGPLIGDFCTECLAVPKEGW